MKHYAKLTAVKGDDILLPENQEYIDDALDRRLIQSHPNGFARMERRSDIYGKEVHH